MLSGLLVQAFGYRGTFMFCGLLALCALVLFAVPTATHDLPMRIRTVIGFDFGSFRMLTTTTRLISVRTVRARAADKEADLTASREAVTPQPGHETRVTPRPRLRDAGQDGVTTGVVVVDPGALGGGVVAGGVPDGALAGVGVAAADDDDQAPVPRALSAATRKT